MSFKQIRIRQNNAAPETPSKRDYIKLQELESNTEKEMKWLGMTEPGMTAQCATKNTETLPSKNEATGLLE